MAKDERMEAWLTWHSRQLVLSLSPYVVVGLLIFIPTSILIWAWISSLIVLIRVFNEVSDVSFLYCDG